MIKFKFPYVFKHCYSSEKYIFIPTKYGLYKYTGVKLMPLLSNSIVCCILSLKFFIDFKIKVES